MPKASLSADEQELSDLTSSKTLKACSSSAVKKHLKDIIAFLSDDTKNLASERVVSLLEDNGFAKEILRDTYVGKDAPQATQVLTAAVLAEICGLTAPEFIFEGHEKKVVQFLIRQFEHLEKADRESETYKLMYNMLEQVVRTGLFTFLTDPKLEGDELLAELFDVVLNKLAGAAEANKDVAVTAQLEELLKGVLDEMTQVTEEILELLTKPLGGSKKKVSNGAGRALVKSVLRRLSETMVGTICNFITKKLDTLERTFETADKAVQKETLEEVHFVCTVIMSCGDGHRNMASTLFPHVAARMTHDSVPLRRLATLVMCRVFELHTTYYTEFSMLFNNTLKRFNDISKDIRLSMVEWAARFLPRHKEAADKLVEPLHGRLTDADVDVRKETLKVVVDLCANDPTLLPSQLVSYALDRIQDKKPSVSKFAMAEFSKLYNDLIASYDKVGPPYNTIPTRVIAMYLHGDVDTRREAEKLLITVLLPEDEAFDTQTAAEDAIGPLAVGLVKMWNDLSDSSRATFSKIVATKKPLRDLTAKLVELKPALKRPGTDSEQARIALHKVVTRLHQTCAMDQGLEQLLTLKEGKAIKCLQEACEVPEKSMSARKALLAELRGIEKAAKDGTAAVKGLAKNVEILMNRLCFPVTAGAVASIVSVLKDKWEVRDGKRCQDLAELVSILFSAFPEVCHENVPSVLQLLESASAQENESSDWGGENDEEAPLPSNLSPQVRKRMKVLKVSHRRRLIKNLLHALKAYAAHFADELSDHIEKADLTKAAKFVKKLAFHAPEDIAKAAVQLLSTLTGAGSPAAKTTLFNSITEDALTILDPDDFDNHQTLALLRILQQSLVLHPAADKHTQRAVKTVTQILLKVYKMDITVSKTDTFKDPPLLVKVYTAGLKVFVAYIMSLSDKLEKVDVIKQNFQMLMKYCEHTSKKENDLAAAVQTTETTKAMLKLGRDGDLRKILYSAGSKFWQTIAFVTTFQNLPEARDEVGRVLHRDITKGKLPMQFVQLLVVLLVDKSKANYHRAKERVGEVVNYFRLQCKQYNVKLDSPSAPGLCPEYIVPPLIHLLARWSFLETLRPNYEPIQRLLYVFFDKLTEKKQCISFLFNLLSRLKSFDDALQPNSTNTRLICDVAFFVLRSVTNMKDVKIEPLPYTVHIPRLFAPPQEQNRKLADQVFVDRAFVAITKKNDKGSNPLGLEDDAPAAEKSPKKRAASTSPPSRSPAKQQKPAAAPPAQAKKRILQDDAGNGKSPSKKAKPAPKPAPKPAGKASRASNGAKTPASAGKAAKKPAGKGSARKK